MGSAKAHGQNRAKEVVKMALDSPLLNDNHIKGANQILLLIMSGHDEATLNEIGQINHYLQKEAGGNANIIMGAGEDLSLEDSISVTVIATGVLGKEVNPITGDHERVVVSLHSDSNKFSQDKNIEQSNSEVEITESPNIIANSPENKNKESKDEIMMKDVTRTDFIFENSDDLPEEVQSQAEERKKRLLKFSNINYNNQTYIKELEDEPAYKRQGVELDKIDHSSYDSNSRIILNVHEDDSELKSSNSFLHDNVD
jgi:cell division protein FtsZ